jgi:hypothetical protein
MIRFILTMLVTAAITAAIPILLASDGAQAQSAKGTYCKRGHWNPSCK